MPSQLKLAVRNVVRQRRRTLAALLAISLGVTSILLAGGFVRDIFDQLAEAIVHSGTGHIQIAKREFFSSGSRSPERHVIDDPERWERLILAQPGVTGVLGRISFSGLLSNGKSDLAVIVEASEPAQEARLGTYVRIEAGRRLAERDRYNAVLGEGLSQALDLRPGAAGSLIVSTSGGAINALDLDVVGVSKSFSREYDARAVRLPLQAAQELLATSGVNVIVVSVENTASAEKTADELRARLEPHGLEVRLWHEVNDFYDKAAALYDRQFGILQLIILLMVLLSVVNTMSGTIFERTAEFGTMRALGTKDRKVFLLILAEGTILGLAGSVLGTAVGALVAAAVSHIGIPMPPPPGSDLAYVARITLKQDLLVRAFLIGLAATVLGSVPAGLRSSRIQVVDALRGSQTF